MIRMKMAAVLAVVGGLAAVGSHQVATAAAPAQRDEARKSTLTVEINGSTTAARNVNCLYAAYASGGTPPYTYSWIGTGLIDGWSDQTATYKWTTIGNKAIRVDVEDALGATAHADLGVTVLSTGSC